MIRSRFPILGTAVLLGVGSAWAGIMERPIGIKIGQRLTLKPYVSVSASYDNNVEGRSDGSEDVIWTANPGLFLEYRSESWTALANAWYQYNSYVLNKAATASQQNYHSYGEDLTVRWTDSLPGERGWSFMASEKYQRLSQLDNMIDSVGHEYDRDSNEFKFAGAVQRRITDRWHADVNANYYWLDYENNNNQGSSLGLYGWNRWGVGAETGYAFSRWTDLLIAGSYQRYQQDNCNNAYFYDKDSSWRGNERGSSGWTVQGGFGSYATEKLTYRALGGVSTYDYDKDGQSANGFTYTVSANWIISETWKTMILATSHYQPTEREFGSSQRVDSLSWGLAHSMVQGKLHGTFDIAYRREGRENTATTSYDYDLDILVGRLGLTYILNRYLQLYGNLEYRRSMCEEDESVTGSHFDYDRFRATLGMRFTY